VVARLIPVTPFRLDACIDPCRKRYHRRRLTASSSEDIATGYDKTALSFRGFLNLAAARIWVPSFIDRAQAMARGKPTISALASHGSAALALMSP